MPTLSTQLTRCTLKEMIFTFQTTRTTHIKVVHDMLSYILVFASLVSSLVT